MRSHFGTNLAPFWHPKSNKIHPKIDSKKHPKNDRFLDLLAIETHEMLDKNYEMNLIFSGDMVIKLIAEAIEVTLDDQGMSWESKHKPKHRDL